MDSLVRNFLKKQDHFGYQYTYDPLSEPILVYIHISILNQAHPNKAPNFFSIHFLTQIWRFKQ